MKRIILILFFVFNILNAQVIDESNLLSVNVKEDLNKILKEYEKHTSIKMVVELGNSSLKESLQENKSIVIFVSNDKKEFKIEVSSDLKDVLNRKIISEIIEYTLKPNFKARQYELGVLKAINEIKGATKGEYTYKTSDDFFTSYFPLIFFILIFSMMFLNSISKNPQNKFFYKFSKSVLISALVSLLVYIFSPAITENNIIASIIAFVLIFIVSLFNIKSFKKGGASGGW